ncbi:MAG: pyrroline-5-carboxylate reductase [SAR86 cluster bacterium]|uniref:Pyrroline-5-carboxylate reductase n=1 Tax=SAR86 cluster bacterium TaxID=2030880 RepID=A0A2A4MR36_9GAMM|nr:MAG: pyrroline-5-carboxylate reductase [SAR86 cluster bacterium]
MENSKIGFIGAGNMASSLIQGLLAQGVDAANLSAADIDSDKLAQLASSSGINAASNTQIAASADVILLAVKPQVMQQVCEALADELAQRSDKPCLIISIAAGISIPHLQAWLGADLAIVRCMPNTPALVGKGATGLFANTHTDSDQRQLAEAILSAVGLSLWLNTEADIDAVTALSGSGPAYFFLLMEAMQDTAIAMGLDAQVAKLLTYQTGLGAAELAFHSDDSISELRRKVTSPGGTTEQAVNTFLEGGLPALVEKSLKAAQQRSQQLAAEFGEK